MTASTNKLAELTSKLAELKREATEKGQQLFSEACEELFDQHPNLVSFAWEQYAPYFNDGDPCVFHVRADEPDLVIKFNEAIVALDRVYLSEYKGKTELTFDNLDVQYAEHADIEDAIEADLLANPQEVIAMLEAVSPLLDFLMHNEDVAEVAFGSDSRVIVSRDGVEIKEVSHD